MKSGFKLAVLGAAIAASSTLAHADAISGTFSLQGSDSFTSSTVTLDGSSVGGTGLGAGTTQGISGNFASYLANGDNVQFNPSPYPVTLTYTDGGTTQNVSTYDLFTVYGSGGSTFDFLLTSYQATYHASTGALDPTTLHFLGFGTYTSNTGLTDSIGGFDLYSSFYDGVFVTTFQGSTTAIPPAATPEPGSLMLLGSSLLGAAAVARRRFATSLKKNS